VLGQAAKIFDVDYAWRAESGGYGSHGEYFMEKRAAEAMWNCRTGAQGRDAIA
jgi:hypothetical protein